MEQLLEEENCPIFKLFMYCVELEKKKSYLSCSIVLGASQKEKKNVKKKRSGLCDYFEHFLQKKERVLQKEKKDRTEKKRIRTHFG